ncbi:MAG: hypothetical protein ISS72_07655 [Candidatus Brocadiae bacterium]|nr:hypothetical protein [Candidatus Brocadiia bacterium]
MARPALCSVWLVFLAAVGVAAEPAKAPAAPKLPHLRLDLKTKTVEFDGTFLVADYPLELLVTQGAMRDYESIISTPLKPSHLHVALLALGLKPRVRDKEDPGKVLREGDAVDVWLRYAHKGKVVTRRPHEFIVDVNRRKPLERLPWVFYGSLFFPTGEDKTQLTYLGDAESWVIGLLGNAPSVVDVGGGVALEYGMLEIDKKLAPAQGTKTTVIIRPAAAKGGAAGGKKAK